MVMQLIYLTLLCLLAFAPLAKADNAMEDFTIIEGAGLRPTGSEDALAPDMWKGSKRADITEHLQNMPANSRSPAIRDLIKAILLSESNTDQLDDYEDVAIGEDLLTLRIYKLMEGGFFKEAYELYSVAIETPEHEAITKAGILAMLASGEKSIACLELKTLRNMNMRDRFWPSFMAYCNYTLSERPSKDVQELLERSEYDILRSLAFNPNFIFPYSMKDWSELSLLEQNVLIAEQKIEVPAITKELLENIPPQDIAAILRMETLRGDDLLKLTLKAYEWGLVDHHKIAAIYKENKTDSKVFQNIAFLYNALLDTDDPDAFHDLLREAINLKDEIGYSALTPFVEFLSESSLKEISANQMKVILNLFYRTNESVNPQIIENYIQNSKKNLENDDFLMTMNTIPLILKMPKSHDFMQIMHKINTFHKGKENNEKNVIENVDKGVLDVDNATNAYEKSADIANSEEAVLNIKKKFKQLSKRESVIEIAFLSVSIMFDQSIRAIDKDLYTSNIEALESVKLYETSRKMTIERLIGD